MLDISILTLAAVFTLIILLYTYITKDNGYFNGKPFPSLKPIFLFGNSKEVLMKTESRSEFVQKIYNSFPNAKFIGFFELLTPVIMIRDPKCLKQITVKDFDYFQDHRSVLGDSDTEPSKSLIGNSLFLLRGQKWRDMRATLSPAFTGSKMRQMFELVSECARDMSEYFLNEAKTKGRQELEMKDVFSRLANDVIATAAFGLKVDSFKEKDNGFYVMGKKLTNFNTIRVILNSLAFKLFPKLMVKLGIDISDKNLSEYFKNMILETMKTREKENIIRPDMINLLIQLKKGDQLHHQQNEHEEKGFATVEESNVGKAQVVKKWDDNELIAQCLLFFIAGFETISTSLSVLAYELIVNPEVQQRLYEEIKEINENLNGEPLTYDVLQKMKYMDMVVSETLRKRPPTPVVDRQCVKDYVYDDENGMKFKIEKGKILWIPIYGLHHDEKYFPNPDKFDPERFSEENKGNINAAAYVPFGVGPRNCIGSRFALMEIKAVIYYLLLKFSLVATKNTQIPLKLQPTISGMTTEKGIFLEFKPRK